MFHLLKTILVTRLTKFKLLGSQQPQVFGIRRGYELGLLVDVEVVVMLDPLVNFIRIGEILHVAFSVYPTCIDFNDFGGLE